MAISYLEGTTQMEIRPASSDRNDVLFEMVTSEFTNICCRVDTSYDLVVRDVGSGAILFCINGAEIENHPVEVYANGPIGKINHKMIYISGESSQATLIQGGQQNFTINNTEVRVTPGQVKIDWPQNVSNEMKVMTIAFALNISLIKQKTTVIGGANTNRKHHQYNLDRYTNAPPSTPEVLPRKNRPTTSVFALGNMEQNIWLTTVGHDPKTEKKIAFLMDKNGNVILLATNKFMKGSNSQIITVKTIAGVEEFTAQAFLQKEDSLQLFNVQYCGQEIGRLEYNTKSKVRSLIDQTRTGCKTVFTRTVRNREDTQIDFIDSNGNVYGAMNKQFYTALRVQLSAGTSPVMKKLIVCTAIIFFGSYLKNFDKCPHVNIKPLKCNCSQCLQLFHDNEPYHLLPHHRIFKNDNLKLKLAGHSKKKNVTYLEVFGHFGGEVLCTLEVTPIKDFRGVAKVVCKAKTGYTLFTSLNSPVNNLVVVYNSENSLEGYIREDNVINNKKDLVLTVGERKKTREYNEALFGKNVKYHLFRKNGRWISAISNSFCHVNLYRPCSDASRLTLFEFCIELTLAAMFHSDPYGFDRIPTPEIVYCYKTED